MKVKRLTTRAWFFFRTGYSTYIVFMINAATFLITSYYLFIKEIPALSWMHLLFYVAIMVPIGVLSCVWTGYVHFKLLGTFQAEQDIAVESNQYNYKLIPGVNKEVMTPVALLSLTLIERIAEHQNVLSDEEHLSFLDLSNKLRRLLQGEAIGMPKRHQLRLRM